MKHFSHALHDLVEVHFKYAPRFCNMCNLLIPIGPEGCYCCMHCRYFIHKECAELPEDIDHTLHPTHSLKLTERSSNNTYQCYYCEKPVENDIYVYACSQSCSDFNMHMTCAMIPLPTITSNDIDGCKDQGFVQFACHQQQMTLVEHLDSKKSKAKCFGCQTNRSGPVYSCISKECENFLHKSCAELPRKIQHPFHSSHSLILQVSKPLSCRSCCKKNCRLVFNCHEYGCNITLCIECVSLKTLVKCRSHDHLLSLVEKSSCKFQCEACHKSFETGVEVLSSEVNHTQSFIFRCMECASFNFHFLCGPLPSIIKYDHHMHPLVLSNHSVSKDDSNKYYCDTCEEEREQAFRIYYCEECKYAAHIHCLIFEIMKAINGETKDMELKVLGEDRWNVLDIESKAHQLKENASESTLKEIMDMLTEEEKEKLIDPFAFNDKEVKVYRRNSYRQYRRYNVRFDREGSNNDIDRIKDLFLFKKPNVSISAPSEDVDDFKIFQSELHYFEPRDGLVKLLESNYLRQKVEAVDGYKVPNTLASILLTLLSKYGRDLVGMKELTPAMKSITATLLCIVIRKMCITKVEDVTKDDLRHWYFYLTGIEKITGFTLIRYLDSFEDIMTAFLGFEAIRYEKDIRNKLETKMEECKANLEKLKINTSNMSDFMKTCSRKASEWKERNCGDMWF